ncbi:hypothetical protein HZU40_11805 [Mycolicibacterium fluoranthenivorans]|uniref:Uncharacterized protein n=1 Tax=Mycolicibacterium fluoranthenivorans TaxID=258505 RepID=A0A7G8PKK1_9MYCO|nr:hypothetical protein HZU40_11805 [Mycolicibacterium fluoranthenivorans]
MSANRELDDLLHDRFNITTTDFVAALKRLPALRPWATSLTEDEARLLDDADFAEDHDAHVAAATEVAGQMASLTVTAFTAKEVAVGLGVTAARVRQKRLAGELWAISDGPRWIFPVMQFETNAHGVPTRQVRGLDQVFKALPAGLHPVAIAGFLSTPQADLLRSRALTPVEWLRAGGDIDAAVAAAANVDWYTA